MLTVMHDLLTDMTTCLTVCAGRLTASAGESGSVHICVRLEKVVTIGEIEIDLMDPKLRSLRSRMAGHASQAKHPVRGDRAAQLRAAKVAKIQAEIDPDGTMPPDELAARVKSRLSEQAARAAYAKAKKALERKQTKALEREQKAAGPSVAPDGSASGTTISPLKTEQESR